MKNYEQIVDKFQSGATKGKAGNYVIHGNTLEHRTMVTNSYTPPYSLIKPEDNKNHNIRITKLKQAEKDNLIIVTKGILSHQYTQRIEYKHLSSSIIAKRLSNGSIIGNSSILPLVGRRMAWGNESLNRKETEVQRYLSTKVIMIPFNVFIEAKLNIDTFTTIDKGPEEKATRTVKTWDYKKVKAIIKDETVHFTGASLFKVDDKFYLFDLDRRELKHKIFNPFLVQLPRQCGTIKDAYASLMPEAVTLALKKKKKVLRQGEWFFIPVKVTKKQLSTNKVFGLGEQAKEFQRRESVELKAGERNRPNYATKGFIESGMAYVSGEVTHSGREHAPLKLKGWYKALPNTAFDKSFTIRGDVD